MEFNLGATALVNAAGAFLFLVIGLLLLALARTSRLGRLVGMTAAFFGLTYVLENLVVASTATAIWTNAAVASGLVVAQAALVLHLARPMPPRDRRLLARFATLAVVALAVVAVGFVRDPSAITIFGYDGLAPDFDLTFLLVTLVSGWTGFLVVAVACALRAQRATGPAQPRAYLLLGLSAGLFAVLALTVIGGLYAALATDPVLVAGAVANVLLVAVAAFAFVPIGGADRAPFRMAFVAWIVTSVLGCLVNLFIWGGTFGTDYGVFGIIRTIGAGCLVLAVLKYDLLGVPLPHVAVKRGVLATGALAALFIVAQVAQNFFAAQYGLLMGGVVAGAVVFAASPIQRAMERAGDRKVPTPPTDAGAQQRREDVYIAALRLAMRDRRLTRDEEVHLHRLAEELGIGAGRAHELMVGVEGERPRKRRAA